MAVPFFAPAAGQAMAEYADVCIKRGEEALVAMSGSRRAPIVPVRCCRNRREPSAAAGKIKAALCKSPNSMYIPGAFCIPLICNGAEIKSNKGMTGRSLLRCFAIVHTRRELLLSIISYRARYSSISGIWPVRAERRGVGSKATRK